MAPPTPQVAPQDPLAAVDKKPSKERSDANAAHLARVRENQRRSRARRKEYLTELEEKFRRCEQAGVEASAEMQQAARRVLDENIRLRALLRSKGVTEEELNAFAGPSVGFPQAPSASEGLEAMLNAKRSRCSDSPSTPAHGSFPSGALDHTVQHQELSLEANPGVLSGQMSFPDAPNHHGSTPSASNSTPLNGYSYATYPASGSILGPDNSFASFSPSDMPQQAMPPAHTQQQVFPTMPSVAPMPTRPQQLDWSAGFSSNPNIHSTNFGDFPNRPSPPPWYHDDVDTSDLLSAELQDQFLRRVGQGSRDMRVGNIQWKQEDMEKDAWSPQEIKHHTWAADNTR